MTSVVERSWTKKFVGRATELDLLQRSFDQAVSGHPNAVVIGGEAGIGKSRLVRRFLEAPSSTTASDFIALVGGCRNSAESPMAYGAIIEALRHLGRATEDVELFEALNKVRLALGSAGVNALADGLDEPSPGPNAASGADLSRAQLFESILSLFEDTARRAPLVLVIEDMQWADKSTRDLVEFLVGNFARSSIFLILTYRSDELLKGDAFLGYVAQLARNDWVQRIKVDALDRQDLMDHLHELQGGRLDDSLAAAIWDRSQGNPFYAEELLVSTDGGDHAQLPVNVRDVMLARFNALPTNTQKLLRYAAAGGHGVDQAVLASVADDLSADEFDTSLREALTHQVLVVDNDDALNFRHVLLQEVIHAELLAGERKRVHARFAEVLTAGDAAVQPATLARHFLAAGDDASAFRSSLDAAGDAQSARGYAESHVHYEQALALWPAVPSDNLVPGVDKFELLDQCAWVSHLEGDNSRSVELIRTALNEVGNADPRVGLLRVRLGSYLGALGRSQEALAEHEAVVRSMSGQRPSSAQAEALCAYADSLMAAARHRESASHAEEALVIARSVEDRVHEVRALTTLGSNLVVLGQPQTGAGYLEDALALAEQIGRPTEIAAGYRHLALVFSGPMNRLDEALVVARRGARRVNELGLERHWGFTFQSIIIDTLFRAGQWDEAVDVLAAAMQNSFNGSNVLDLLLARLKLTIGRGDFGTAESDLDAVSKLLEGALDVRHTLPLATLRAGLELWKNDLDAAEAAVQDGLDTVGESDDVWFAAPLVWHAMRVQAERAERARAIFDAAGVDDAKAKGERLRARSKGMCESGRQQGALRLMVDAYDVMCQGELLRIKGEAAPEVWSVVTASWKEVGQPYPLAYAQWRWAEALLGRPNGVPRATPLLRSANEIAIRLGAVPLRIELESLARRAQIDLSPRSTPATDSVVDLRDSAIERMMTDGGLTKREVEILVHVADGKSNRGIAEVCFISEKTASVHVSNIMTKLGVHSRVQAANLFHRAMAAPQPVQSTDN